MKLVQFAVVVFALVSAQSAFAGDECPFRSKAGRHEQTVAAKSTSTAKEAPKALPATKGDGADGAQSNNRW